MNKSLVMQGLWIGTKFSRIEKLSLLSFLKNSYTVHLYTYFEIDDIPEGVVIMDANKIIPEEKIFKYKHYDSYAAFANLFRYKLLYENGGYWFDLDIICLKPFTTTDEFIFASERLPNQRFQVNNCLIGVPRNSEIMEFCYSKALNKIPDELAWGETGPKLLTEAVINFGLQNFIVDPDVFCPVNWWECQHFISKSMKDIINENVYTIHLWNEMWRRNKMDKNIFYNENCIYEELNEFYS